MPSFPPALRRELRQLTLDPTAQLRCHVTPVQGLYWSDELPPHLFKRYSHIELAPLLRVFHLRVRLWKGLPFKPPEAALWAQARDLFPRWPFFQRLNASSEVLALQSSLARECRQRPRYVLPPLSYFWRVEFALVLGTLAGLAGLALAGRWWPPALILSATYAGLRAAGGSDRATWLRTSLLTWLGASCGQAVGAILGFHLGVVLSLCRPPSPRVE